MSRWTPTELAQALADNPALRLSRQNSPLKPNPRIDSPKRAQQPVMAENGVSGKQHKPRKDYKAELVQQCELLGLKLEPEFKFHPERKFRADWIVGRYKGRDVRLRKVLVEFEGGLFSSGKRGHSSVSGILRDMSKANEAQILGFIVVRVAPNHIHDGTALTWIENAVLSRAKKYADRVR